MLHHVQRLGVNIFSSSVGNVIDPRLALTKSLESRMTISLTNTYFRRRLTWTKLQLIMSFESLPKI